MHANLARMYTKLGRTEAAEAEFAAATDAEPDPVMQHVRRGEQIAILHPERRDDARREFEAALSLDPRFAMARSWLARLGN